MQSEITSVLSDVAAARAKIEQAKGVLMAAYGTSAERAFDILVWRSQGTNVKVRHLAARFLAAIAGKVSPDTRTHIDRALVSVN